MRGNIPFTKTLYQTTLVDDLNPVINGEGGTPTPPPDSEAHGDVTSLGILGRFGVAPR